MIPQYEVADKRIDLVIEGAQSRLAVEVDGDHWHGPEQYDADMERQRQLERCQWTFHRIRESEFYFFKEETLNKLWHALESHGIHPIGSTGYKQKTDGEQENIIEDSQVTKSPPKTDGEQENTIEGSQVTESPPKTEEPEPNSTATKNLSLTPYTTFEGSDLEDPSSANCSNNKVAEGLSRIVEAEGPMLAKRAYDVYIRACGIRRLGRQLKTIMNRAMQHAIRTGKIEREDEWDEGGVIHSIVRAQGSPKIKLREKGPRDLDEIPASELLIVARLVKKTSSEMGDEAHIRDILECYGLKRLTSPVQKLFDDLFELRISYVDDYVIQKSDSNPDRARNKYFPL